MCAVGLSKFSFSRTFKAPVFQQAMSMDHDRALVIIRLNGGNDGLNTVIPVDQYENLLIQRPDILIPQSDLLPLAGYNLALHPKMTGMQQLFNNGELSIIQNVGAEAGRSHFRATEVWLSGIGDQTHPESETGWLGRVLDVEYPGFPMDYPNANETDPFAITFSTTPSGTCEGHEGNFAHPVLNPYDTSNISGGTTPGTPNSYAADHLEYLQFLGEQTNEYNGRISDAVNLGNSLSTNYGTDNVSLAMQNVAKLISGGLQSKIYVVEVGGFDTHSNQVDATDVIEGNHANLWEKISTAVSAFQEDLHLLNLNERVMGMTFSEFGRQIAQNGSRGTDHGDAACMFLFGSCVNEQVIGNNPIIDDFITNANGLDQEIDYRDVYSTLLKDWFGLSNPDIEQNFEDYDINYLNLLDPCIYVGTPDIPKEQLNAKVYPNPSTGTSYLEINLPEGPADFIMVDLKGRLIGQFRRTIPYSGEHHLTLPVEQLDSGTYFLRIRSNDFDRKVRFSIRK